MVKKDTKVPMLAPYIKNTYSFVLIQGGKKPATSLLTNGMKAPMEKIEMMAPVVTPVTAKEAA